MEARMLQEPLHLRAWPRPRTSQLPGPPSGLVPHPRLHNLKLVRSQEPVLLVQTGLKLQNSGLSRGEPGQLHQEVRASGPHHVHHLETQINLRLVMPHPYLMKDDRLVVIQCVWRRLVIIQCEWWLTSYYGRLSGNHTVTENEMSGEPYSQKSGWKNHSNEQIFQVMTFEKKNSLCCITCNGQYCSVLNRWLGAHCGGWSRGGSHPHLPNILSETKLFHFHGIFKINEMKSA